MQIQRKAKFHCKYTQVLFFVFSSLVCFDSRERILSKMLEYAISEASFYLSVVWQPTNWRANNCLNAPQLILDYEPK